MASPPQRGISLCAGGGGLDMGLELAEPGFVSACYVEWEPEPRQRLIAGQRAGYLAPAPIWDNIKTFDARPWRGIDTLLAGYPCQPFSQAGQRRGANDPRHLWPHIARIIEELGPQLRWCFFENVSGHLSLGFDLVADDLRRMDFTVAAGIFSAGETDAAQERQRLFIVAYRKSADRRSELEPRSAQRGWSGSAGEGGELGDPQRERICFELGSTRNQECRTRGEGLPPARNTPFGASDELADTSQPGPQGREQPCASRDRNGPVSSRSTPQLRRPLLHAPGPSDLDTWRAVLDLAPDLAPALSVGDVKRACDHAAQMVAAGRLAEAEAEHLVRRMADGLAQRTHALRILGNGVHPLAAAHAWRSLSPAHGLGRVDLDAEGGGTRAASDIRRR